MRIAGGTEMVRGFTLIELMVVLTIISIGALLAAPSYAEFLQREQHLKTVNQLQALYRYSRSEAVKRDESINLNLTNGVLKILTVDNQVLRQFTVPEDSRRVQVTGITNLTLSNTGNPGLGQQWQVNSLNAPFNKNCITIFVSGQVRVTPNACV
ncbi:pilus assembly FimT family protein [Alishewanella sp. d11]|uniref:pilus assembly FimT family protein n=1 Tax=Alishewanella sp. d11 TaxID=3414030 RepID=UPI003BF8A1AF